MNFCVTSYGLSASRWVSFVLAAHPEVFVAHGTYDLDSIINGCFESERKIGKDSENFDALLRGRELHRFVKKSNLRELYQLYKSVMPSAKVWGNVHSFVLEEVFSKSDVEDAGVSVVNLLRHPISFVDCHNVIVAQSASAEELSEHYTQFFNNRVRVYLEKIGFDHTGYSVSNVDKAFLISCYSVINQAEDIIKYPVVSYRMEELTKSTSSMKRFCEDVTGLAYNEELVNSFIEKGSINNHRKLGSLKDESEIYQSWEKRHQKLFDELVGGYRGSFKQIGYSL